MNGFFPFVISAFCFVSAAILLIATAVSALRMVNNSMAFSDETRSQVRHTLRNLKELLRSFAQPAIVLPPSDAPRVLKARRTLFRQRKKWIRSVAIVGLLLSVGFGITSPFPFYCVVITLVALLMLLARGIL